MPRGMLAEDGPHREYVSLYGAREHEDPSYPPRTRDNAAWVASEAGYILCFDAGKLMSPGTKLLSGIVDDLIRQGSMVSLSVIKLSRIEGGELRLANEFYGPEFAAGRIIGQRCMMLMVAGNRESKSPGIEKWVEAYLTEVFRLISGR